MSSLKERKHVKKYSEKDLNTAPENENQDDQELTENKSKVQNISHTSDDLNNYDGIQHANRFEDPEKQSFFKRLWENLSIFKYIIIVLFVPPFLNLGALQREANGISFKGEKVDMGWGQKVYLNCKGSGLPTVILDSPTGSTSDLWFFVLEELSKYTKVCAYDRSGLGYSDPIFHQVTVDNLNTETRRFVSQPHTLDQMTSDLHHLRIQAKSLQHPFILVGADVGALIARMYAMNYPNEVSDVVLIDPLIETIFQENKEWQEYWFSKLLPYFESLHLSAILGVSRMALIFGQLKPIYFQTQVPEETIAWQKSLLCNPRHMNAVRYEHFYINESVAQMRDAWFVNQFPANISVSVIAREKPNEFPPHLHNAWEKSQRHLIENLHPNCDHKIITDSDFLRLYAQPSPIVLTVQNLVKKWRNKFPHS